MKPTHRLTYIPDGDKYLFNVVKDTYYWSTEEDSTWRGPFSNFVFCYVGNINWKVEKINQFKGNK